MEDLIEKKCILSTNKTNLLTLGLDSSTRVFFNLSGMSGIGMIGRLLIGMGGRFIQ